MSYIFDNYRITLIRQNVKYKLHYASVDLGIVYETLKYDIPVLMEHWKKNRSACPRAILEEAMRRLEVAFNFNSGS